MWYNINNNKKNMPGGRLFKKIILISFIIFIYIILTSSIIDVRSEIKVSKIVVESIVEWSDKYYKKDNLIIQREKNLTADIDNELAQKLAGKILIQVENDGEAWYVYPVDLKRYYLGRPKNVLELKSLLGIALDSEELINYLYFDKIFPSNLAGKMVYDTANPGSAYYVDPETRLGHELKEPNSAWRILKEKGLGVSNENIRKIVVGELNSK